MLSLRALAPTLISVVAALVPVAEGATVTRQSSLEALVRAAQRIVVAEVVDVRAERARGERGDLPAAVVTLRILETLKGRAALQTILELPGGELDGVTLDVSGMPQFRVGDRDVLFLHETPGMLSPIVGVFAGRFRIRPGGSSGLVVRTHDGGRLPAGLLSSAPVPSAQTTGLPEVELSAFTREVRRLAATASSGAPVPDEGSVLAGSPSGMALPGCLRVKLGPSPALSDGCRDWACAVARAVEASRFVVPAGTPLPAVVTTATPAACAGTATIEWGTAVHARQLDNFTRAVLLREQGGATDGMRIVLNGALEWDARDGQSGQGTGEPLDMVAVLSAALTAMAAAQGSGVRESGEASDSAVETRAGLAREPRRLMRHAAAGNPCDGGSGALVNPRLLIFESPDHARMTGYQVGFFPPGASTAAGTVNLSLDAFLERRSFDLPPWEVKAMERTLVASIASAGLLAPAGRIFTYRVRGVWPGGATAWSEPSQPFVRCPQ